MGQKRYPSKSWFFRQHGQQQLYPQYKVRWIIYKGGRYSFIFTTLLVHTTTLKSPLKICSSTSVNFYHSVPPLHVHKIIFIISNNTLFFYTSAILSPPYFCVQPYQQSTAKTFILPQPFSRFRMHQGTKD